jgi:hypothetical protein
VTAVAEALWPDSATSTTQSPNAYPPVPMTISKKPVAAVGERRRASNR